MHNWGILIFDIRALSTDLVPFIRLFLLLLLLFFLEEMEKKLRPIVAGTFLK